MRTGRHSGRKSEISSAIHAASISVGYPENDKFQRFFSLDAEDLLIDPTYPGLPRPRTEDFLMVEILLSSGTDPDKKNRLRCELLNQLNLAGVSPNDVMVLFTELDRACSSYGNGALAPPVVAD